MHKLERQKQILTLLEQKEVVTVDEICMNLTSSPATVRRDLNDLDRHNLLVRVHGGAASVSRKLGNSDFETKLTYNLQQKKAIAEYAANMCQHGDSIILNGGTTTWLMCEWLHNKSLQLLTNSLPIATTLQNASHCQIFLTGGEVYADQHIVLGDDLPNSTRQFYASKMFAGAHAISQHGLMESDSRLIRAERMLISQADELIVLADSSKFTGEGSLRLCPLNTVSTLITDDGLPPMMKKYLADTDIKLIIIEPPRENSVD